MTQSIMLQGTGSDVGKTVLVAGLCRLAANRGMKVRPFKPQNMSNNAAVADDGGEIGRAQWLQALACRVPSSVHMNPVLLKPQSSTGSQIVVQGKVWGQAAGRDYQRLKPQLMGAVMESWETLRDGADLVIVEGAGSPAEVNLRASDIANMGFATKANVPVVLVGDIDRGGVIASLVGTHTILSKADRQMITGYLINKFRGDISLFDSGLVEIEKHTGWPCFGVIPWLREAGQLPAEDSVVLERVARGATKSLVIAVPLIERIANFDDFDPLMAESDVELVMVRPGERLPPEAGLVVIPGSKATISDLMMLRDQGWDHDIDQHVARGGRVLGICGGFQMLGNKIYDPHGIEGPVHEINGLGLLNIETVMAPAKTVQNTKAHNLSYDVKLDGYEIHLGKTQGIDCKKPFNTIDGRSDGAMSKDGKIVGTYMHGLFANDVFRGRYLEDLGVNGANLNYRMEVDRALDQIAGRLDELVSSNLPGFA